MPLTIFGHDVLHFATAVLAIGLFALSLVAYRRKKNTKFLFICVAFLLFALKESILAGIPTALGDNPLHFFVHFLNFLILVFFAIGILK